MKAEIIFLNKRWEPLINKHCGCISLNVDGLTWFCHGAETQMRCLPPTAGLTEVSNCTVISFKKKTFFLLDAIVIDVNETI